MFVFRTDGTPKKIDVITESKKNNKYKKILFTNDEIKISVMSIEYNIPMEKHGKKTQHTHIVQGKCIVRILNDKHDEEFIILDEGENIVIPPNVCHEFINISDVDVNLKVYSVYFKK